MSQCECGLSMRVGAEGLRVSEYVMCKCGSDSVTVQVRAFARVSKWQENIFIGNKNQRKIDFVCLNASLNKLFTPRSRIDCIPKTAYSTSTTRLLKLVKVR